MAFFSIGDTIMMYFHDEYMKSFVYEINIGTYGYVCFSKYKHKVGDPYTELNGKTKSGANRFSKDEECGSTHMVLTEKKRRWK